MEKLMVLAKQQWNPDNVSIYLGKKTLNTPVPDSIVVKGIFNEAEKHYVYSIPLMIEDIGGDILKAQFICGVKLGERSREYMRPC